MAEGEILGNLGNQVSAGMGAVTQVIVYVLLVLVVLGLAWLIWYIKSFKIKVIIREVVNGRKIIKQDKGRVQKTKDGKYYFQLLKGKVKREVPPDKCFDISNKGKKSIELYYVSEDDTYIPITDDFDYSKYKENNLQTLKPFTTTQRQQVMYEFREAESYKKKKLGEQLLQLAPYIILVLILAVFMIFFENVVKPTTDLGNQNVLLAEKMTNALTDLGNQNVLLAEKMTNALQSMESVCLDKQVMSVCLDKQVITGENIFRNNVVDDFEEPGSVPN